MGERVGERAGEHAGECVGELSSEHVWMRAYVYAQSADTSTKTFMLHIAVSRRPMAKLKIKN
jgi:hypothetical protein